MSSISLSPVSRRGATRPASFTLAEMAVVMAIIAILASLTLPAVIPLMRANRLRKGANMLRAALVDARTQAISSREAQALVLVQYVTRQDLADLDGHLRAGFDDHSDPNDIQYITASRVQTTEPIAYLDVRRAAELHTPGARAPFALPEDVFLDVVRTNVLQTDQGQLYPDRVNDPERVNGAISRNVVEPVRNPDGDIIPGIYHLLTFNQNGSVDALSLEGEEWIQQYRSLWLVDYRSVPARESRAAGANSWPRASLIQRQGDDTQQQGDDSRSPWARSVTRIAQLTGRVSGIDPIEEPESERALLPTPSEEGD